VKTFVRQYGDLVLDPLRDAQPVKTGKCDGDMVMVRRSHVHGRSAVPTTFSNYKYNYKLGQSFV